MTTLHVTVLLEAKDQRYWRLSDAIDPGALRLAAAIPFDRGTRVRARFRLPGGAAVATHAVVVDEHTLEISPAPPEREAIEAYLREEEP